MRWLGASWLSILSVAGMSVAADHATDRWKTYRSEKFGYEFSYPSEMEYVAHFDGSSGTLVRADTRGSLARFEVWPPSKCLVSLDERTNTTAREVGIQRAGDMTQADGPGGSSYCRDPVTVRESGSLHGARIYELELSCVNEEFAGSEEYETKADQTPATADGDPVVTFVGLKGPTYFVDISQPWLKRVLIADPAGGDPRVNRDRTLNPSTDLRRILETMRVLPAPEAPGICIQDLP